MIINGASRRSVGFWSKHLTSDKNERVSIIEIRGLAAETLLDGLLEIQEDATHTRCKNFLYHLNINPTADERLTPEQWERTLEIFEGLRGIPEGQPRIVVEHEKEGRVHRHVIYSRIVLEEMKAWHDGRDAKVCHEASRQASEELGLHRSISPFDKDREGPRPERAPKSYESFRGLKSGLNPRDITAEVTAIYHESMNAADFVAGLHTHGFELVRGDRRNFCILDSAGDVHSLSRRLGGVNSKELRAFMREIETSSLPSVEQAKAGHSSKKVPELNEELAAIRREIDWEEALAKAAIEKEKEEKRFVEKPSEPVQKKETRVTGSAIEMQLSRGSHTHPSLHFEDAAKIANRKGNEIGKPPNLQGTSAIIWQAFNVEVWRDKAGNEREIRRRDPNAFRRDLESEHIMLAKVTAEEAQRSHMNAAFAREVNNLAPRYREGEIVAVTEEGNVFKLSQRTTGHDRPVVEAFLKRMDQSNIVGLEATKQLQLAKAETRNAEIQQFRDVLRLKNEDLRTQRATKTNGVRNIRVRDVVHEGKDQIGRAAKIGIGGARVVAGTFNAAGKLAEGLFGMLDPVLTPVQKAEARIAESERSAEAAEHIEISKYAASQAKVRQAEAADQRNREAGGRERD